MRGEGKRRFCQVSDLTQGILGGKGILFGHKESNKSETEIICSTICMYTC